MSKAKLMYAFDHIPQATGSVNNGITTAVPILSTYSDFPFQVYNANAGTATVGVQSDTDGIWLFAQGGNYLPIAMMLPISLMDMTKPASYFGFRYKLVQQNQVAIMAIRNATMATLKTTLVYSTDYAWVVGQQYYVEVYVNWVNGTRSVWVDNVLIVNNQPITPYSYVAGDFLQYGDVVNSASNSGNPANRFKDFYFMDDPGDGSVARLGPIIAKPIGVATASGNNWNPSAGTAQSALATAINTSTPSTPNVTSATDGQTPLVMTLSNGVDANANVMGVLLVGSGERNTATGTMLRSTIQDQATPPNQLQSAYQFPAGAFAYGRTLGFFPNAPDGSTWTGPKIAALTVSSLATAN
jgi:hypothetical protein